MQARLVEVACSVPGCSQMRMVDYRAASITKYCRDHALELHRERQRMRAREKRRLEEPAYRVVKSDNFPFIDILESVLQDYLDHGWFDDAAELVKGKVRYAVRRVGRKQELVAL